jgi:cation diffusion facilitator family transporter
VAPQRTARALTLATIVGSLVLGLALLAAHVLFRSQLALAQAADSISDMLGGAALAWAVRTSAQPADEDHPRGHHGAEPIAALVVAVLAGVLAVEVLRAAVVALVEGAQPELDGAVAAVFALKVGFKLAIVWLAGAALRQRANPALDALRVDARNDVLVGSAALLGFGLARAGLPAIDAGLAIAIAIYVGWSGVRLARTNVALLMGASAPAERREKLAAVVRGVEGVRRAEPLTATWHGASLDVYVEIAVDRELSLRAAHEIGHAVERRLAEEEDVARVVVHVEPDP